MLPGRDSTDRTTLSTREERASPMHTTLPVVFIVRQADSPPLTAGDMKWSRPTYIGTDRPPLSQSQKPSERQLSAITYWTISSETSL